MLGYPASGHVLSDGMVAMSSNLLFADLSSSDPVMFVDRPECLGQGRGSGVQAIGQTRGSVSSPLGSPFTGNP